jgi:hypothetical protein
MRRLRTLLLGGLLLAAGAGRAGAQSLYGPGGLFLLPTASLPEKGQLTPAVLVLPQHSPLDGHTRTWESASLDYGATRNLELGATVLKITTKEGPSEGGFAKYRFLEESANRPAVAAGFTLLGFGKADTSLGFLALRKQLGGRKGSPHPVIAHLGFQYVGMKDGVQRDEFQPYGGMEIGLMPRLEFIGEAARRIRGDFATPFALTLAYRYSTGARLALTWANTGRSSSPRFGVGAGITIGSR